MKQTLRTTFSLLFILKKAKLLKNGEAPIVLRLTINGRAVEISTKRSIPIRLWNQDKEEATGKDHKYRELNYFLQTLKVKIYKIQHHMEADGVSITAQSMRDKFYGKDDVSTTLTICQVYSDHNEKCRALIGHDYTKSTVDKFDTSLRTLKTFILHQYHKEDMLLSKVNNAFIENLEFYLKTVRNCQHNSAMKHLKHIKKVIRITLANNQMKHDPFANIKLRRENKEVEFLTKEELDKLIAKEFEIERISQVRDIFVFCCMTGLAYIDVKQLGPEHIIKGDNGQTLIYKPRQKTGYMSRIPMTDVAQFIIDKYANHPTCIAKEKLLPVLSNQKMNNYLKEIADACGIKKRLTMHVARHTCATIVMLSNNVSLNKVSKILGHSSIKMTEHYAKVLDASLLQEIDKVNNAFSNIPNFGGVGAV